jgi:hypothetical protein
MLHNSRKVFPLEGELVRIRWQLFVEALVMSYSHRSTDTQQAKWVDMTNDGSLQGFAEAINLSVGSLRTLKAQVALLPLNTVLEEKSKVNLFPPLTKEILFALREGGHESILYDDARERRELVLKSTDILIPIILFIDKSVIAVCLDILANLLYDRFVRDKEEPSQPSVKVEYAQLDMKNETVLKWRRIEGPAREVARLLREESNAQAKQTGTKT